MIRTVNGVFLYKKFQLWHLFFVERTVCVRVGVGLAEMTFRFWTALDFLFITLENVLTFLFFFYTIFKRLYDNDKLLGQPQTSYHHLPV